jgi:Right handed beta helix region
MIAPSAGPPRRDIAQQKEASRMRSYRIVLIVLSVLALVAVAPEAQAASTPITSCGQTVTTSAVLMQDLVCTGSGVVVGAPGVKVNLNGFTIRGDNGGGDYGVDTGLFNDVTVENGALRNFQTGVWADGGQNVTVSKVVTSGNTQDGILIAAGSSSVSSSTSTGNGHYGVYVLVDSVRISSVTASENADYGVFVGGDFAQIKSAKVSGNGNSGVFVDGDSARITSLTDDGNAGDGILVTGNFAAISSSTADGNDSNGIEVVGESASVKGNHADGNSYPGGASDLGGLGIFVTSSTIGPVGKNTALGNDGATECFPTSLC